jgi:hypothetical protein
VPTLIVVFQRLFLLLIAFLLLFAFACLRFFIVIVVGGGEIFRQPVQPIYFYSYLAFPGRLQVFT